MSGDVQQLAFGALQGLLSSSAFVLALFIGFCLLFGLTKLKKTAGNTSVVKSLDETITHRPMVYLRPFPSSMFAPLAAKCTRKANAGA
jgi:hypothetical protein